MFSRTVGRRDAAVERTGMYLQRVLENTITSCKLSYATEHYHKTAAFVIGLSYSPAMSDFYQPPNSEVETPVIDDHQGAPWKGILVGLVIDIVGGTLFGIILLIGHTIFMMLLGQPIDEIADSWQNLEFYSLQSLVLHSGAFVMTFLGAYFCVRIINHRVYFYVTIYAALSAAIGLLLSLGSMYTIDQNILLTMLVFAVSLAAAWLHTYRQRQKSR